MLRRLVLSASLIVLLVSCFDDVVNVKVTSTIINGDYIGNGAEWDPYDEACPGERIFPTMIGTLFSEGWM